MRSVRGKVAAVSLAVVAAVILASGAVLETMLRAEHDDRLRGELARHAQLLEGVLLKGGASANAADNGAEGAAENAATLAKRAGLRLTLIDSAGVVVVDSDISADDLDDVESHATRPEVKGALLGRVGLDKRTSATTGVTLLYLAKPLPDGRVLRVAMPASSSDALVARVRLALGAAALLALMLAVLMSFLSAHLLTRSLRDLVEKARARAERRTNTQIRMDSDDELENLAGSVNRLADDVDDTLLTLEAERDRFRAVVEGIADGVVAVDDVDGGGVIILMNSAARTMLAHRQATEGMSIAEVLPDVDVAVLLSPGAPEAGLELSLNVGAGDVRRVIVHGSRAALREGAVLLIEDVTDVRRLENVRRDFVANVSHELRTPVSVIRASAEALIDGGLDDKARARRFADALHRNAERLSRLVSDLLDLARIESGRFAVTLRPVVVKELVKDIVAGLQPVIDERKHTLHVDMPDDIAVLADSSGLEQVLSNLVHNATKYTPDVGHIVVSAAVVGDDVLIAVEDNGPGIPVEHRDRVFERFYRVDAGRSREMGGTGLGLSIVKHLAAIMGGDVHVEAGADDKGARFVVRLPRG